MGLAGQRARLGMSKAITFTVHKLTHQVYTMLKHGNEYIDAGQEREYIRDPEKEDQCIEQLNLFQEATTEWWSVDLFNIPFERF